MTHPLNNVILYDGDPFYCSQNLIFFTISFNMNEEKEWKKKLHVNIFHLSCVWVTQSLGVHYTSLHLFLYFGISHTRHKLLIMRNWDVLLCIFVIIVKNSVVVSGAICVFNKRHNKRFMFLLHARNTLVLFMLRGLYWHTLNISIQHNFPSCTFNNVTDLYAAFLHFYQM